MLDVQTYLESGIVEEYCLGLLPDHAAQEVSYYARIFPEIQKEIEVTEGALLAYANRLPKPATKAKTMALWQNLASIAGIDLNAPPLINRHSDIEQWNHALAKVSPTEVYSETIKMHTLLDTPQTQLVVAWLSDVLVEDEHHPDEFTESFLILEGTCECNIGGRIVHLQAGDFLCIPPNTHHVIKNTSATLGYVKALIQRHKTAA